jgi:alpha-galactosidase
MAKIVFLGAGSVVFAKKLMSDILGYPELEDCCISLVDTDAERLNIARKMAESFILQKGVKTRLEVTNDRRKAFKGADYVILIIKIGRYDITKVDFDIPMKYGLKQTIGDTCGVGGISRALRTIPVIWDICRDMEELCPDAILMNYTNPMSMICLSIFKKMPGFNVVGLCHSVQATKEAIASYVNIPHEELSIWVAGINHMAWFLELNHNRESVYPLIYEAMKNNEIYAKDKVKFEIMRRTGYFVTESSTHMSEYVPYFLKRDETIEQFSLTPGQHLINLKNQLAQYEETKQKLEQGESIDVPKSNEFAPDIIHTIETGKQISFTGNVYNARLISNLPYDSCVEVPCMVDREGIHPCQVGNLPIQLAALNITNINVHQLLVEALITGKKEYIYQAAMMDPNTASVLSLDEIWKLMDELLEAHKGLIPVFK